MSDVTSPSLLGIFRKRGFDISRIDDGYSLVYRETLDGRGNPENDTLMKSSDVESGCRGFLLFPLTIRQGCDMIYQAIYIT